MVSLDAIYVNTFAKTDKTWRLTIKHRVLYIFKAQRQGLIFINCIFDIW